MQWAKDIVGELLAQGDLVDVSGKLSESGMVAILLFFLLIILMGLGATVRYLMKRLFDEEKGIITKIGNKMVVAMDEQTKSLQKGVLASEANVVATNKVDSHVVRIGTKLDKATASIEDFRVIWRRNVNVLRAIAEELGCLSVVEQDLNHMAKALDRFTTSSAD